MVRDTRTTPHDRRQMLPAAPVPNDPQIDYPEGDGKPMAESGRHAQEILRLWAILLERYRHHPLVFSAANIFVYFQKGNPRAAVSPDIFITFGVPRDTEPMRDSYFVWLEQAPPTLVIEVASRSTRREDDRKRDIYRDMGVKEYILYDPGVRLPFESRRGRPPRPALQGWRLSPAGDEPLAQAARGGLWSEVLGARLLLVDGRLQYLEPDSDRRWPTEGEAERERADALAARAGAIEARAEAIEARAGAAETQLDAARARAEVVEALAGAERARGDAAQRLASAALSAVQAQQAGDAVARARAESEQTSAEAALHEAAARIAALELRLRLLPPLA